MLPADPSLPADATPRHGEILPPPRARRAYWGPFFTGALVSGLVTAAFTLGHVSLPGLSEVAEPAPVEQTKPPAVTVITAGIGPITESAVVTGQLRPREEVRVSAELEGHAITEILAEEGDVVREGQVLARLSRDLLDVELAQNDAERARANAAIAQSRTAIIEAEAAVTLARQALERAQKLSASGNTTAEVLEQRQSAASQAQARLESTQQALNLAEAEKALIEARRNDILTRIARTDIKAPADGVVLARNARLGTIASGAGEPLFRLMRHGEIEFLGEVPETTVARMAPGMPARVVTPLREEPFKGRVRLVSPEVGETTRLGAVRIAMDAAPGLTIGAFGRATVDLASRSGVLVPQSAILYGPDGATVQVVKGDVVETRPVTIGLRTDSQAEIVDGLVSGETVVATAGTFVRNGDRVTPMPAAPTATAAAAN